MTSKTLFALGAAATLISGQVIAAPAHPGHEGRGPAVGRGAPAVPLGLAKKPGGLPPGQAKKIWSKGQKLPVVYLQPRYVIVRPATYHLPAAPAGYRWVLVDDRAYLVQPQTDLVTQVVQLASALLR